MDIPASKHERGHFQSFPTRTASLKPPNNSTHPSPSHPSQALVEQHGRRVRQVRRVYLEFLGTPHIGPFVAIPLKISAREFRGGALKARLALLRPTAPRTSYCPQSFTLWRTLPQGITLPMPWPGCSPAGPEMQRGKCAEGYPG
jgi:hypothetical protein